MRYRLATYRECKAHREWNTTCPDCGRKGKFSPYIDTVTMQPVDDKRCGRCNRLSNCGYHLPPRMVARTEDFVSRKSRERRENSDYISSISHANLANHAKFASLHSRIVPRQHSAQPTAAPTRYESVGCDANAKQALVCDEENFSFPEECCLQPFNLVLPRSAMQPSRDLRDSREEPNNQQEAEEFYDKMHRAMQQSQPWGHHLATWLRTKFPREQVDAALKRYHVGGTPDGATLWWQIDEQGRVHTGKAMQYNPLTGHRVKEETPSVLRTSPPRSAMQEKPLHRGLTRVSVGCDGGSFSSPKERCKAALFWGGSPSVNWAHRMRLYGEPTDLIVPQCLFGLHLIETPSESSQARRLGESKVNGAKARSSEELKFLSSQAALSYRAAVATEAPLASAPSMGRTQSSQYEKNAPVTPSIEGGGKGGGSALVESEKTALILSLLCPDKLWLATGGKANFKEAMLMPLLGYEVEVYPDADALADWYVRTVEMNRTLGTHLHIPTWYYDLMNHDEARRAGLDLADVLLG